MSSELSFFEQPEMASSVMITAWKGWGDAASGATKTISLLVSQLGAKRLASIDHQRFSVYTNTRPNTANGTNGRYITWPKGEFYYLKKEVSKAPQDLVFFFGDEPDLYWSDYTALFTKVASNCDVKEFLFLGALQDNVPHTRKPLVGVYPNLYRSNIASENSYEGPVSIGSVIAERLSHSKVRCTSYWGHTPHYLQNRYNPEVVSAMIEAIKVFLPKDLNFVGLQKDVANFKKALGYAFNDEKELNDYVLELEDSYDSNLHTPIDTTAALNEVNRLLNHENKGT